MEYYFYEPITENRWLVIHAFGGKDGYPVVGVIDAKGGIIIPLEWLNIWWDPKNRIFGAQRKTTDECYHVLDCEWQVFDENGTPLASDFDVVILDDCPLVRVYSKGKYSGRDVQVGMMDPKTGLILNWDYVRTEPILS